MRLLKVLAAALFLSSLALGQMPMVNGCAGYYGCGPFVPLVTTPSVSLQTVSPSPVGATNATTGLIAGARNSTLSLVNGNTSSVYTEAVWYSGGGAPEISSPAVSLEVRPLHHGEMHGGMHIQMRDHERGEAGPRNWTYIASLNETVSPVEASAAAKSGKKATRTITNQDIDQENQKTGTVKYGGKTEEIK
jgi:hypothetical protein